MLGAEGELTHWSEEHGRDRVVGRDDIAGYYYVAGASIDLTNVRPLEVGDRPDEPDQLFIRLDENIVLNIVVQVDVES